MKQRIKLLVEVDLDPIRGTFHTAASAHENVLHMLRSQIPHYNPEVFFAGYTDQLKPTQQAVAILPNSIPVVRSEIGHGPTLDYLNEAETYYLVVDDRPDRPNIILPEHLFRRCFRFLSEESSIAFRFVEEIQ